MADNSEPVSPMTVGQVHDVAFGKPPLGTRGYDEGEVDDFLDKVALALTAGPAVRLTAGEVRDVQFASSPFGRRGYDPSQVDDFLDRVAAGLPGTAPASHSAPVDRPMPARSDDPVPGLVRRSRRGLWRRLRGDA